MEGASISGSRGFEQPLKDRAGKSTVEAVAICCNLPVLPELRRRPAQVLHNGIEVAGQRLAVPNKGLCRRRLLVVLCSRKSRS